MGMLLFGLLFKSTWIQRSSGLILAVVFIVAFFFIHVLFKLREARQNIYFSIVDINDKIKDKNYKDLSISPEIINLLEKFRIITKLSYTDVEEEPSSIKLDVKLSYGMKYMILTQKFTRLNAFILKEIIIKETNAAFGKLGKC